MTRWFRHLVTATLVLIAAACSNARTVQESPTEAGVQRSFDAPYEKVRDAARAALTMMNLKPTVQEDNPEGFVMVIARPPRAFSWGEVGRVIVIRSDSQPITVHALYEKRANIPFHTSDGFGRNLFTRMERILAGDQIPPLPPTESPESEKPS